MTLGFGIVGYGKMADWRHRNCIQQVGGKMVAVCDPLPVRRELAEKQGAKAYEDYDAFLAHPGLDVVIVATPSNSHADFAIRAARAGKHVLTEKPMAANAQEALEMVQTARKHKVLLTVYQSRRFDPNVQATLKVLESGRLGKVIAIERRVNGWGPAVGFGIKEFHQAWRVEKAWGGGALNDFGPHVIDQLLMAIPSTVVSVYANLRQGIHAKDCDDYALGMLRFADGTVAVGEVNFMTRSAQPGWNVIAEKGTLQHNPVYGGTVIFDADGTHIERIPDIPLPPVDTIYQSFVNAIQGKGQLVIPPEHALRVMRIMDAYRESDRTGGAVQVNDSLTV